MHALFVAVLQQKNLSKAGDLFSLEDNFVIKDLRQVLSIIQQIISQADFLTNHNDQSLVEICITRLTSAIRETRSIELHAEPLVNLLETCLTYNLRPISGGPDPPHAKIASDVMSCIFLNYSKKSVMRLALPISVKFLHKGNRDLSRNMASYLSLAAIENADLLAQHTQPIIDSVISGNYSLSRVLPQIYSVNPDPIKSHIMTLVSILANCENSGKLALLSLFGHVAKDNPALLEPSIPQLCEGLTSSATAPDTLQVLFNMALTRPTPLADHTEHLTATADNFPKTSLLCIQVMSAIAKAKQEKAAQTLEFIMSVVGRLESDKHSLALKEIVALTSRYPHLLTANLINKVSNLEESGTSATTPATRTYIAELRADFHSRSRERLEKLTSGVNPATFGANQSTTPSSGITIVKVGGNGTTGTTTGSNSRSELNILSGAIGQGQTSQTRNITGAGSRSELAHQRLSAILPASTNQKTSLFLNGQTSSSSSYQASPYLITGTNIDQRNLANIQRSSMVAQNAILGSIGVGIVPSSSSSTAAGTTINSAVGVGAASSRSTGRLPTSHRSMTRLNLPIGSGSSGLNAGNNNSGAASLDPTRLVLHKSMTRLNGASQQSMTRLGGGTNTGSQTTVTSGVGTGVGANGNSIVTGPTINSNARSITCITGNNLPSGILSSNPLNIYATPAAYGMAPYHKSSIPGLYSSQAQQARVTVIGGTGHQAVGTGSPTKSMSSGSMSNANAGQTMGIATSSSYSSDGLLLGGKEVLTVNVNQINADLIRQVSSVLSHHDIHGITNSSNQHHLQQFSSSISQTYPSTSISVSTTSNPLSIPTAPSISSSNYIHPIVSSAGISSSVASSLLINSNSSAHQAPFSLPPTTSRRVPPYSSGPLPTIPVNCSSQPPSLGVNQPNNRIHAIPNTGQVSIGPNSIIPTSLPLPTSNSTNTTIPTSNLHGAGNGSTKSMNRLRNKNRESPQKAHDTGNFVGPSGANSYVVTSGPNRGGVLSNTLPSPRRRKELMKELMQERPSQPPPPSYQQHSTESIGKVNSSMGTGNNLGTTHGSMPGAAALPGLGAMADDPQLSSNSNSGPPNQNRMSVFEPYPMRDTVQHFCEKHLNKIKSYMESLTVKLPLPVKCTIEERKGRKHAKLHFGCQAGPGLEEHCLYKSTFYALKTRSPRTWIHLMFLALQARSTSAISTRESSVSALKNCWEILKCENISFVTLVTGAFPPAKAQDGLLNELRSHRFFDVFEYNAIEKHWGCFLCNHPDRAHNFVQEQVPVIEGQLKEKKGGKWKLFKKWKSRYFTLSGAKLSYKESPDDDGDAVHDNAFHLDVGSIRSVKVSKEGRRNIPKAFEIFTDDRKFILKAKDGSNAQEWVQCLSVAKAHSQAKDSNLRKLAYGGSLGRLNHHGRTPLQMRAHHQSHHGSTTLSNQLFKTTAAAV